MIGKGILNVGPRAERTTLEQGELGQLSLEEQKRKTNNWEEIIARENLEIDLNQAE